MNTNSHAWHYFLETFLSFVQNSLKVNVICSIFAIFPDIFWLEKVLWLNWLNFFQSFKRKFSQWLKPEFSTRSSQQAGYQAVFEFTVCTIHDSFIKHFATKVKQVLISLHSFHVNPQAFKSKVTDHIQIHICT